MIIAITGLGGSGKTSVLELLKNETSLYTVHYPDMWILTSMLQKVRYLRIKKNLKHTIREVPKQQRHLSIFIKALVLWLDSWLVWLIRLCAQRRKVVICDRYAYDQMVYLNSVSRFGKKLIVWLSKIIPRVNIVVYFDLPAEVAQQRKYEWDLQYLHREVESRRTILREINTPVYMVDATASPEILCKALKELIEIHRFTDRVNQDTFLLLSALDSEIFSRYPNLFSVLKLDFHKLSQSARRNRLTYALSRLKLTKLFSDGDEMPNVNETQIREKWCQTLEYLGRLAKQHNLPMMIIKNFLETPIPRLPNDVDVCIMGRDEKRVINILQKTGKIRLLEPKKWLYSNKDFLPVDLYIGGIYESGLVIIQEQCLWEDAVRYNDLLYYPSPEIQTLLIIAHSIHETASMTLFDLLQVKHLASSKGIKWNRLFKETETCGWSYLFTRWLKLANLACKTFFGREIAPDFGTVLPKFLIFPFNLPLREITYTWWKMNLKDTPNRSIFTRVISIFGCTIKALRICRVRLMGRIPFHEN